MSIILKNVTKKFGRKTVIEDFSIELERGSRTAIAAFSGSGKTTLFRIIAGLEKRFDGEMKTEGKVALMFQEDRLFDHCTVLENVLAVADRDENEARRLLAELGLEHEINSLPTALSGGMKRRVALARALFYDGDIVLLDECFTGLDSETAKKTAEVINRETDGKTLVLITHNSEDAKLLNCQLIEYKNGFINK